MRIQVLFIVLIYFINSKNEFFIVFGDDNGKIKLYKNYDKLKAIKASNNSIISIKFSKDGKYIVSSNFRGNINC